MGMLEMRMLNIKVAMILGNVRVSRNPELGVRFPAHEAPFVNHPSQHEIVFPMSSFIIMI